MGRRRPTSRSGSPTPTAPPTPTPRTWSWSRSPTSTRPPTSAATARSTRARRRRSASRTSTTHPSADTTAGFHYAYSCSNGDLSGATYASSSTLGLDDLHLPRRRLRPHRHGADHRPEQRLHRVHDLGARHERRSDDRDQRRGNVERGLGLQPDPGRGHRSGHRHRLQLRRPLGRRQHDTYAHERRQDAHLRRRPERPRRHGRPGRRGRHVPRPRERARRCTSNNVAPTIAISGAANVNEGSAYSLTLGAVTDPGTDTVTSYIVHWGDGNSDTYALGRRQDAHLRRRRRRPRRSRSTWSTRTAPSSTGQRALGARRQRRSVDRDQRRGERQRGLGLQPDPGRGHRPGHGHGHQLRRPLGRRQHRHLRHGRRQDAHLRRRPRRPRRSPSTWSTRTAPSPTRRTRSRCT